jgi:DUF1009 family protein
VGPGTLDALLDARAAALAFEAGRTLLLARDELVARADALGICLLGVDPEAAAAGGAGGDAAP